jgi:DNA-binding XRE family transcriptional regulator/predicted RNase H-like HicB family nuclease
MQVPEGYYAILFNDPGSGTVGVRFPEHPGVITYGGDFETAKAAAREALNAALESDFDRSFKLPPLKKHRAGKGEKVVFISLDPEIRTAYLLRTWREEVRLTQQAMAQRLGISYQAYQRMERPGRSNLTVATLEKIAACLGRRLVVDFC